MLAVVVGGLLGSLVIVLPTLPGPYRPFVVMAAVMPFVAMVIGDLRRPLLAAIALDVLLDRDFNIGYREDISQFNGIGGLSISVTTFAIIGLWVLRLTETRRARGDLGDFRRVAVPLLAYVVLAALSIVVAAEQRVAFNEVFVQIQSLLVFAYLALTLRSRGDVLFVLAVMLVGVALQGILALSPSLNQLVAVGHAESGSRFAGALGSPNVAGGLISLLLVPAGALLFTPVSARYKLIGGSALLLGSLALILTFSRGGWLGFLFAVTAFSVIGIRRGWLDARAPVLIVVLLAVVAVPFGGLIQERLTADDKGSAASRGTLAQTAARIIRDHPLLGVGANNYGVALPDYRTPDTALTWASTVHNKYLLVWAENGTAALIAFLWFLAATIAVGLRASRSPDPVLAVLALAFGVSVAGQMLHMGVDLFHARPQVQSLWMIAGLLVAISRLAPPMAARSSRRAGAQHAGPARAAR